jgi:hypothetical protein
MDLLLQRERDDVHRRRPLGPGALSVKTTPPVVSHRPPNDADDDDRSGPASDHGQASFMAASDRGSPRWRYVFVLSTPDRHPLDRHLEGADR